MPSLPLVISCLKEHGKGFMKIEAPNFIFEVGDLINAREARHGWQTEFEQSDLHPGIVTRVCDDKDVVCIMFADCNATRMACELSLINRHK